MGKIKLLSEKTINQIAAGEVVERPSSIVKELIENSIDAGALNIFVDIENGGKKRITVKDDGCGMTEDDIFMAFERHATSKIKDIADLEMISTMGFRGEAVPSIAAVTHFSISSATAHGDGYKVVSKNGVITENGPVSMPKGTEITCSNLFHNVPARRKFLKSDEREMAHIKEIIQKFSIIHYKTGFSFTHNGRNLFTLNPSHSVSARISDIWKLNREMIRSFNVERNGISVTAHVPSPFESPVSLTSVSVNGRIVNDRVINGAILRTFREQIGGEFRSPVVILLEVQNGVVDINVHPSKLEVRFRDPFLISEVISNSITGALKSFRPVEKIETQSGQTVEGVPMTISDKGAPESYSGEIFTPENENLFEMKIRNYKKLGVLFGVYQIIEMTDRVIFLDQHASHERITFTALKKVSELKSGMSQMLIAPIIVALSDIEKDIINSNIILFSNAGFLIEQFDESSVAVRAVPAIGFDADWAGVVREMAGELENYSSSGVLEEMFLSRLATAACRSSVKRNDLLTPLEIDSLIEDINNSESLTCPHGRPFFFSMSRNEFEKKVKRQ
jgi:DNA mismatch repair protein MutL